MKNQALFSSNDKSKKLKCHLLQFLFGALKIKRSSETKHIRKDEKMVESIRPSLFVTGNGMYHAL